MVKRTVLSHSSASVKTVSFAGKLVG